MTAQVVAQDLWKWGDTRITRVITFGSPAMTLPLPGVVYNRYAVEGDQIPLIPMPGIPEIKQTRIDNGGKLVVINHLAYPDSSDLALISPFGDEGRYQPLYLDPDPGTDKYFTAPNF